MHQCLVAAVLHLSSAPSQAICKTRIRLVVEKAKSEVVWSAGTGLGFRAVRLFPRKRCFGGGAPAQGALAQLSLRLRER